MEVTDFHYIKGDINIEEVYNLPKIYINGEKQDYNIAGTFRKYTNEYRCLFVGDAEKGRTTFDLPMHSRKIENFEVKIGDYKL